MAGIYIHIPFCKQACNYCNFYFSTSLGNKDKFLDSLHREIDLTKDFFGGDKIETLYFGGGTPSQLEINELERLLQHLHQVHDLSELREFTIETNPDDLTVEKVKGLKTMEQYGLNRFSIGVQSFFDDDLKYMNRAHDAKEALSSIQRVQDAGFKNITMDLIYGTPTLSDEHWLKNLETAFALQVPHISSYALTVEPKTALENKIKKGVRQPVNEEQSARQFQLLMEHMRNNGFEQYEISNFARNEKYAIHNSNYWNGKRYLGLGPSAHSYDGHARSWNVANNIAYIAALEKGERSLDLEVLTTVQVVNEKIMTGLRTKWGVSLAECPSGVVREIEKSLEQINKAHYIYDKGVLRLTDEGKLFADAIAAELFLEEEFESF